MDLLTNQISNPWVSLGILILGGILALIGRSFLEKYVGARALHIAEGINFPEKLERTFADQAAKSAAARLDVTKAEYAIKVLGLMSEIEALIFNWKLTAFFHSDELKEDETVEDLGIRDLKKAAQLTIVVLKVANEGSVLLGDNILTMVMAWIGKIHALLFDQQAAYNTSKVANEGKPAMDNDRVITISNLTESEIYPAMESIGKLRTEIKACLRKAANIG